MLDTGTVPQTSDAELTERVRSGDTRAFAELWQRHYRPAYRAAQQFSRTIDTDDLISEAYLRVYQQLLAGRGPRTAFRPYLYATIRNIATTWATSPAAGTDPLEEDPEDPRLSTDPLIAALDRSLTSQAFRSLPERWQTVLWYTEIEGMDPHEVAPILGLSPNGVAALSHRAREGLRQAWLQAHVSAQGSSPECSWAISKMGGHARDGLGPRDSLQLEAHLAGCTKCVLISAEVDEIGSRLALVMIPLILGGVAGGGLLASLNQPSLSTFADAVLPSLPDAAEAASADAGSLALPIIGSFSLAVMAGRRARLIGIVGVALLVGSLILGFLRSTDATWSAPEPAPATSAANR